MSANGVGRRLAADALAARKRAQIVSGLRTMARAPAAPAASNGAAAETESCDLCGVGIPEDHRHLLHLE